MQGPLDAGPRITSYNVCYTKLLRTQHAKDSTQAELRELVMEEIIKPVLPGAWLNGGTKYHINPTGRFEIGGPVGDAGLTGRKIIVDTYGGMARHGGGAFSGKDPRITSYNVCYTKLLRMLSMIGSSR